MPSFPAIADFLGSVTESAPFPLAATEGETHVVRYANSALCRFARRQREDIVGHPLAEALPSMQEHGAVSLMDRVYRTGADGQAVNLRSVRVSQGAAYATYTVWPIVGKDSTSAGLMVLISDTTDEVVERDRAADAASEVRDANRRLLVAGLEAQEQTETHASLNAALREALDERDRALEQAQAALKVRDEFLAIAAHELRTPLATVKGNAQLELRALQRNDLDVSRVRRHLERIRESIDRLERLLVDLMDVSRDRSGELIVSRDWTDLSRLVNVVTIRYTEALGTTYHVSAVLPDVPVPIQGDAVRLEQVLDNLLNNAVKYTPEGGAIVVRLAIDSSAAGAAVLTVTDSGIGLPPGESARIFEAFGRASNARQSGAPGMGLGLHICQRIVEAHGGRMWAESAGEGLGTTLAVWLPLPLPTGADPCPT